MDSRNPAPGTEQILSNEKAKLREASHDPQLYDLLPFEAGNRIFAVFAEQVEGIAEGKTPAPLPFASSAVLGVVCVSGRMLTVLDPIALSTGEASAWPASLPWVIALRGDEQLALAAQGCRDAITIADADIERSAEGGEDFGGPILGLARHGDEEITVLNVDQLFGSAMRRRQRRRRRL